MRSWLSKLTKNRKRPEDPDFGRLHFMDGYWEGEGIFPPTQSMVEYFVTADAQGPSEGNRQAFQTICSNYAGLLANAAAVISRATSVAAEEGKLAVSSLDVPSGDLNAAIWEISFSNIDGTLFSVKYRGLDATGEVDISY